MRQDLAKWWRECRSCFLPNTKAKNTPPLKPIVTTRPFEIIGVDVLEMGLTEGGNRYILTVVDHFTKYLGAYAIPDKEAETIAEVFFSDWICMNGRWPKTLLSDRGNEFENSIMKALCEIMGIEQKFNEGYCPRENGVTERVNNTIVRMLQNETVVPTMWDRLLPPIVYAYNTTQHRATGESPHFLLYGWDPGYPSAIIPPEQLSPYTTDYDTYSGGHIFSTLPILGDQLMKI
ncbi:hypothetical protein Y032_0030g2059 [Ancylostoma ceylanicum]|uniref:Integrase catalytic domain-containing protein n=1 Tax=Ancylostoma ceylanicum TaxID=53326 RepID=A0A016URK4_9BILA|nr:hypothetical protein Y032_0030g2059 [Ancylostoma ceylanicum]